MGGGNINETNSVRETMSKDMIFKLYSQLIKDHKKLRAKNENLEELLREETEVNRYLNYGMRDFADQVCELENENALLRQQIKKEKENMKHTAILASHRENEIHKLNSQLTIERQRISISLAAFAREMEARLCPWLDRSIIYTLDPSKCSIQQNVYEEDGVEYFCDA